MKNMDKIFESFFSEKTVRYPSFVFTGVDGSSLDKFKQVVDKVKAQTKSDAIRLDYEVISKKLTVTGAAVDIYWFGYYTKELL